MKRSILTGLACVLLGTGSANARNVFVGNWESLDGDNRQFRIVETDDGFKMTAPDLSCDYKGSHAERAKRTISGESCLCRRGCDYL
jgi:hypothetical protein